MQTTWNLSEKEKGKDTRGFLKKEPEWKGALQWEQIAQKAGGWQRVKITGKWPSLHFLLNAQTLQEDIETANFVGMLTPPPN